MNIVGTLKSNKKNMVTILSVTISGVLLLCAFTGGGNAASQGAGETVYRESQVQRGDIVVGVTETATATLKTHALSFEVEAELDSVEVKAGQAVKAGDLIATISTDKIQEEISALQASYQEAGLKLSEAQLAQQKGELEATTTYNSTLNKSTTADDTYDMTVEKLEQAILSAEKDAAEINREIKTYNVILGYSFGSSSDDEDSIDTDNLDDISDSHSYVAKYDKNFETAGEVRDARRDAKERLATTQTAIKEAKYNLEISTGEAGLTRDKSISTAELADTIYKMELQSLANGVSSKEIALANVQEQISKYTKYLDQIQLVAPCDGVITAVSFDAGDTVQAGAAVATVSDSGKVFVYISVAQDDITTVTLGQTCTVTLDAFEEMSFGGAVDSITTTPARSASGSASYTVTIQLAGDTQQVYEGMTGSATLITKEQKDVLYVTNRTVYQNDAGQSCVKVKNADESIQEVEVVTGFSDGRNVEIVDGLTEGQTVLIESQVTAQQ